MAERICHSPGCKARFIPRNARQRMCIIGFWSSCVGGAGSVVAGASVNRIPEGALVGLACLVMAFIFVSEANQ